jgi:hypothetical protein
MHVLDARVIDGLSPRSCRLMILGGREHPVIHGDVGHLLG